MSARRLSLATLSLLVAGAAFADPGRRSFQFLRASQGAQGAALGGSGVARTEGTVEDAAINPAVLARVARQEAWASHASVLDRTRINQLGYGHPTLRHGTFAFHLLSVNHDPIQGYDATDARTHEVKASNLLGAASWAQEIRRGLSGGATLKLFRETLDDATANAQALDLGAAYQFLRFPRVSAGLAVRNLGTASKFIAKREQLPLETALGAAYRSRSDAFTASLDLVQSAERDAPALRAGGEFWLKDVLALRVGYRSDQDAGPGFAGGLGFKLSTQLRLNYSYAPFADLGDAHRVSLAFAFGGGKAETIYQEGVRLLRRGDTAGAVLLFDKVLTLQPDHSGAARQLREASERLREELQSLPAEDPAPK